MKVIISVLCFLVLFPACGGRNWSKNFPKQRGLIKTPPPHRNTWVFLLAGQSNMAGYGKVDAKDTLVNKRMYSINKSGKLIYAKEPLHFYVSSMLGLDCGYSYGETLLSSLPDSIRVLIIPTAVRGSSIQNWLKDETYMNVKCWSNFSEKVDIGNKYGIIKGVLWHQGEADAGGENIKLYGGRLRELSAKFRTIMKNDSLPIIFGELGSFSENNKNWQQINSEIYKYSSSDPNSSVINTQDLKDMGDKVHFNADAQRKMGERYAKEFLKLIEFEN